ncbi:hypothetical protein LLH03_09365 [bacterium]|nr:hypothetical protein [bacterium]
MPALGYDNRPQSARPPIDLGWRVSWLGLRWSAALVLVVLAGAQPAHCQYTWGSSSNYVNITEAKVERLSNAIRIILQADGTLTANASESFFAYDQRRRRYLPAQLQRFPISLYNARSQVGRYVDVGIYPVSHITLSVPADAQEGVGLEVALFTYIPAQIGAMQQNDSVAEWGRYNIVVPVQVDLILSDDRRQLIITVHSDRQYEAELDAGARAAGPLRESMMVEPCAEGLTLRTVNAPFGDVIAEVSRLADQPIVVSPSIDRRVTANLPHMAVDELLRAVCSSACLELDEHGGTYYISQGDVVDVSSYWSASVRKVRLQNISVGDAIKLLPDFALRYVKTDVESNTLIAYGPESFLDKIERDIRALDQKGKQLRVRMVVLQSERSQSITRTLNALFERGTTSVSLTPVSGSIQVGVVTEKLDHILVDLRHLLEDESVQTDVRPSVTVLSGSEATVFVGKRQYYQSVRESWRGIRVQLSSVDVGVRVSTSPWTGDGRTITVPFEISADNLIGRTAEGAPIVAQQQADGSLRILAGNTIVVGGLRTRTVEKTRDSLSPLASAPLVGDLLTDTDEESALTDVIVFLSVEEAKVNEISSDLPSQAAASNPATAGATGSHPSSQQVGTMGLRAPRTAPPGAPAPAPTFQDLGSAFKVARS